MAKDGTTTINQFTDGIGASNLVGFGNMRNLNATDEPGVVFPNFALVKDGTTTITARPNAMINFDSKAYMLDDDNTLWWNGAAGSEWASRATSFAQGKLVVWRNLIIGALTTAFHTMDNLGNEVNSGAVLTTATKQMCIVMGDAVYIVGGENISKLTEDDGETFDPSDPGTYTVEKDKLKLNSGATATCVTVWNNLLVVGDDQGNLYTFNGTDELPADISITTESIVQRLITVNRRVYAQIGKFGNWYFFDGIRVQSVKKMPESLFKPGVAGVTLQSEGVAEVNNKIYFAMDVTSLAGDIAGIYSLDLDTYSLVCEDQTTGGTDSDITHGALLSKGDKQYYAGWQKESATDTWGIDLKSSSVVYDTDKAYFESQYMLLTNNDSKKVFQLPTLLFAKPLVADDSVKDYYRETTVDTGGDDGRGYTLHETVDFATYSGINRKTIRAFLPLQSIQYKIVLNGKVRLTNFVAK